MSDETLGPRLRAVTAWALAVGFANQVAVWQRSSAKDPLHWFSHHALDLGQMLALGLASGCAAELLQRRWPGRTRLHFLALGATSALLASSELPTSFEGVAERAAESLPYGLVLWGMVFVFSLTVPLAAFLGSLCRPRWLALPALGAGFLAAVGNNYVLDQDYFGLHVFVTLGAVAFGASALFATKPRWLTRPLPRRQSRTVVAVGSAVALGCLLLPSNRMMLRLSSLEGAPLARLAASVQSSFGSSGDGGDALGKLSAKQRQWFEAERPPVAASPRLLPDKPIVILLSIDCMRADVFFGKKKASLGYFEELGKHSTSFERARSAGSATVPSLSSVFSGRYYSQLVWKRLSKSGDVWPADDPSVRFPQLLQQAGVSTFTVASKTWLTNARGVVRGFDQETDLDQNRKPRTNHVKIAEVRPLLQKRLENAGDEPLFLYAHLMDPHSPYDSGKRKRGALYERYVSEIEHVGKELKKLDDWLKEHDLYDRTTLIVTADHGEAFGEHSTWQHSKTVYDELLRVPLWVRIPGAKARRVKEPVSLIDLGPTLLDLFGVETPGSFMGESLVPLLRGEKHEFTRPIAAEGRLIQTMIFADGKKAIYDLRRGTYELYDLREDPKETDNLAEDGSNQYSQLLRAFFRAHQNPIYEDHAPYRN